MTCGICATAGWQLSNWVASRDELQPEHRTQSIQLPITAHIYRPEIKANVGSLRWQVERGLCMKKCIPTAAALESCVNNPINAKFPNHTTPLPTTASASLSAFVSGICKIIFSWELLYILNSYSIQDLQLPWQYLSQGEREKKREGREREWEIKKKEKVLRVDREITGFIIFSQLILSITNDRVTEGPLRKLMFAFEW